ncbi:MAG: hypothetical protein H6Q31_227 [Bacteroidetes bacterium]|nr:hypothetical protein [Bacteroidota bacterium]
MALPSGRAGGSLPYGTGSIFDLDNVFVIVLDALHQRAVCAPLKKERLFRGDATTQESKKKSNNKERCCGGAGFLKPTADHSRAGL